jgi:biopolymer transport protein ExbD
MKLSSPVEEKKARIEIIPLIDIMFFLLACFMAVSLSMIQMRGVKVALPTAVNTQPELKNDFKSITIDAASIVYLEKERIVDKAELQKRIHAMWLEDKDVRIYIRADKDTTHGEVIGVLDVVRSAGVQKVAFELTAKTVADPSLPQPAATTPAVPAVPPVPPVPAAPAVK